MSHDPNNNEERDIAAMLRERFNERIAPGVGGAARPEERVTIPPPPVQGPPPPPEGTETPEPTPASGGGVRFAFLLPELWASVDEARLLTLMQRLLHFLQDEQVDPLESMILGSMLQAMGVANPSHQVPPNLLLYDLHMQVVNQTAHYLTAHAQVSTPEPSAP